MGSGSQIARLIQLLAKVPGLGPRSARRAALGLLKRRAEIMQPLAAALADVAASVRPCTLCGNYDTVDPCAICTDGARDPSVICVVEDVGDLWALERAGIFRGRYHVLGGALSALDGRGPDQLNMGPLMSRLQTAEVREVVLALNATVEGRATGHYVAEQIAGRGIRVTELALGLPVGAELGYLDDGTLTAAFRSRRPA